MPNDKKTVIPKRYIVERDFTFARQKKYSLTTVKALSNTKEYQQIALEMMARHYSFYGQLNDVSRAENYVTRESKITCDCGDRNILLDAYKDHGVLAANGKPLLTCNDCQVNKNIYSFGLCSPKFPYNKYLLPPFGPQVKNIEGKMCYRCMPVLREKWKQSESHLLIGDVEDEEFVEALKQGAYLTCRYGGVITIEQLSEYEIIDEDDLLVTLEDLDQFDFYMGEDEKEREKGIQELNRILIKYEINTDERIAFFMGQCATESQFGARTLEKFDGDPDEYFKRYDFKENIGNVQEGDGALFRGAGYLHLTGRGNYDMFQQYIGDKNIMNEGYEVVGGKYNRDIEDIHKGDTGVIDIGKYAWESAGWFWRYGNPDGKDLSYYADDKKWHEITENINCYDDNYYLRNENINLFYNILTGDDLDLPTKDE